MERERAAGAIDVTVLGAAACDAFAWRTRGRLFVTVVVKAKFEMVPDGPMSVLPPEPIARVELHHQNNPARSVRRTPDRAPYLPRADVVLTGHARGLGGAPLDAGLVRLALFRERTLFDKSVRVLGRPRAPGEAAPSSVALTYENAYGGVGKAANPFGSASPSLVDPGDPTKVVCFAPMARAWPQRLRLLGGLDWKVLDQPIPDLPPDFDWSYFNVAPLDQRVDYLSGDEWILLHGVHPTIASIRSRLPAARGQARVYGLSDAAEGTPLPLAGDTLYIDGDALACGVLWRGNFALEDEAHLARIRVVGGVDVGDQLVAWTVVPRQAPAVSPPRKEPPRFDSTLELSSEEQRDAALRGVTVPFGKGDQRSPIVVMPGGIGASNPLPSAPSKPIVRGGNAMTVAIDEDIEVPSTPFFISKKTVPPPAPGEPLAAAPEAAYEPPARPKPKPTAHATTAQGIRLGNETPLALDVIPWKLVPSRSCLAVIAKATCDLVPNERATLRARAEAIGEEVLRGAVCVHPSDRVPFKVRADVVAIGDAYAPRPASSAGSQARGVASASEVSLRLGHEGNAFERRIAVHGDRVWERARAGVKPSEAEPFLRMPLTYERAFGGPGFEGNPVGLGFANAARARRGPQALPNLEDPERLLRTPKQAPPPACFAPIPLAWKQRWAKLGRARDAWPCFPEEMDWTLFQAAPPAQRLAFLRGDEPFAIGGMHPDHALFEGTLPGITARAFIAWEPGSSPKKRPFEEIDLHLDTVVFRMDALELSLVWRGTIPVDDEDKPGIAAVHLLVEDGSSPSLDLAQAQTRILAIR